MRFGKQPSFIPGQILLMFRLSENTPFSLGDELKDPFSPGDLVTIEETLCQNLSASYWMRKGADRVQALISLLGGVQLLNHGGGRISRSRGPQTSVPQSSAFCSKDSCSFDPHLTS